MGAAIKVSDDLVAKAKVAGRNQHRSMAGQIEYWAKIGRLSQTNPDLSYSQIVKALHRQEMVETGEVTAKLDAVYSDTAAELPSAIRRMQRLAVAEEKWT